MILLEPDDLGTAPTGWHVQSGWRTLGGLVALVLVPIFTCRADGPWSASIGVTTDYIFRGVSQTYGGAAIQLGGNYQSPRGWFAGAWGSNVDPYPFRASSKELDLYGGFAWTLGSDFTARATCTRYLYLQDPRPVRYDYSEIALTAAYLDRFAATVSYQPDSTAYSLLGFAHKRPTVAYEVTGRWPVWGRVALSGGLGFYDLNRLFGVRYWSGNAGLTYVDRHFEVDVTRFVGDRTVTRLYGDASADGAVVVSALLRF
jgi:uncharacterized protein (TIGR02001 family)